MPESRHGGWLRTLFGDDPPSRRLPRADPEEKWDETAEELLEQTKLAASREEFRGESLRTRAGVLLGACGAAVALSAGTARELLAQSMELGEPARTIAAISLGAALALVVVAGVFALLALRPRAGSEFAAEELAGFRDPKAYATSRFEHRRTFQIALADSVDAVRPANNRRAQHLNRGIALFALGIACFVPTPTLYALDATNGPECRGGDSSISSAFAQEPALPPPPRCPKKDKIFTVYPH